MTLSARAQAATAGAGSDGLAAPPSSGTPPVSDAPPTSGSLRSRALRASVWRVGCYGGQQVIRMASNILLAKLLFPEAFGVVALATVFVQGLRMLSEIGIAQAVIRSHREDEAFLNTAWTLQVLRGVGLFAGAAIIAWPASIGYAESSLLPILMVLGASALIDGLKSVSIYTLNRRLLEGRRAVLELLCEGLIARGVMVAFAVAWPSPWALVAGTVAGVAAHTIGTHFWLPGHRVAFRFEAAASREIVSFGRWIFVGTVIAFFGQQVDKLILGHLSALGVLGVYSIALTISRIPVEFAGLLTGSVLYPALAEAGRNDPLGFASKFLRAREVLLGAGQFISVSTALAAPAFFFLMYDWRYSNAGWIASAATVVGWIGLLSSTISPALLTLGATRALAVCGAIGVVSTGLGCWFGFSLFGLPGFVLGTLLGAVVPHLYAHHSLQTNGISAITQDLRLSWTVFAAAGLAIAMDQLAAQGAGIDAWFAASATFSAGTLLMSAWLAYRSAQPLLKGLGGRLASGN